MERSVSMAAISNINTTVPKIWFPTHPSFVKSINGIQGIHKLMQENDGKSKIQSKKWDLKIQNSILIKYTCALGHNWQLEKQKQQLATLVS